MRIGAGISRRLGIVTFAVGLTLSAGAGAVLADEPATDQPADQSAQSVDEPTTTTSTTTADTPPANTPPGTLPADTPPADTPPVDTPAGDTPAADAPPVQSFSVQSDDVTTLAGSTSVTWTGNGLSDGVGGSHCNTTSTDHLTPIPAGFAKGWLFVLQQITGTPTDWRLTVVFSSNTQTALVPVQTTSKVAKWAAYSTDINATITSAVASNGGTGGTSDGELTVSHCTAGSETPTTHDLTVIKTQGGFSEGDTFQVHVDCTNDAFDTTFTFTVDSNGDAIPDVDPAVVQDIPNGVTCTVTETDTGNPNSDHCDVATTVNDVADNDPPPSINVDPSQVQTVTFDNTLTCDAQVTSEVHDPSHADVTNGTFGLGSTFHDQAIVEGDGPTPTGTVDFTLYQQGLNSDPCEEGDELGTQSNVALSEESPGTATAESQDFTPLTVGDYAYKVHYDGDLVYGEASGPCEPFSIDEVSRSTSTVASEVHHSPNHTDVTDGVFTLGETFHDKAIVEGGGPTPTGTVDFVLYKQGAGHDPCAVPDIIDTESNVALTEEKLGTATAESSDFTPLTVGDYAYKVHYDGDDAYNEGLGRCEPFHVIENQGESTVTIIEVAGITATALPFTGGGGGWPLPVGILLVVLGLVMSLIGRQPRVGGHAG